jgi:hypothetical protein
MGAGQAARGALLNALKPPLVNLENDLNFRDLMRSGWSRHPRLQCWQS